MRPRVAEAVEEPCGAGGFFRGGGGDADELQLPLAELGLVEMQPVEGAMNRGEGGDARDAALAAAVAGISIRPRRGRAPRAGAVGPGRGTVAGGEDGGDFIGL